ncbi:TonB-dependent receptor [Sandarakinorhabdus sp. DWP1-3-1]|uniref:TonB-dependent receptor n=1 Tax=Sandarakinorhabdus sp. DWP1-3-1 TaxID=2804627 RepID=UPI003CE8E288
MTSLSNRRRHGVRAVLLAGIALHAGVANAAEIAAIEAAEADEIIVTASRPIAESESAALAIQKNSDSLISVAASDSVGRLPDQNIAQAAGRLPGVAVQRDQGQARYLSLRGAPINWTTLSFDGVNVISPEGRDSRYDSIPSAIASQIIVRKAVTPDLTGETVAGQIDIRTRSALDYKGFHVAGKAGGGLVELGSREEFEGSLVVANRWNTGAGDIGVLVSGSYYQRNMLTDNFETDWETVSQDQQPGNADRIWARETENKLYRLTRKNYSVSGRLDWEPSAGNRIFLSSIYTAFTDDENRDNYIFDLDDRQSDNNRGAAPCTITANPRPANTGYADVCIGNTPFTGTVYGVDINQRATLRAFRQSIFTNTLGGDHKWGDGWKLGWRLNYSRSRDDRSVTGEARFDSPSTRNLRPTVAYDFTDPQLARLQLFRTITNSNPTSYQAGAAVRNIDDFARPLSSLTALDAVDTTNAYTAKFQLSKDTDLFGGDTTIAIGGQFDQRTKEAIEKQLVVNTAAQFAAAGIPTTFSPGWSLEGPFRGKIPLSYDFRYFSTEKMEQYVKAAEGIAAYTPVDANYYKVREQVFAGYAMATTRFDWGSILGGARVEHVRNRGTAFATINGATTLLTVDSASTLVFPSLHLNYNVDDTKKLRLSFNSGASRADYDQLRPNLVINDPNQTISGGNPFAKPERAYGVDAYFEWYTQPQGYVSIGVFYKKVKDVLFDDSRTVGNNALDSGGIDRSQYTLSTLVNGGSGHLYGLEAAFQQQLEPYTKQLGLPAWMGGFGVTTNLTLNRSEATTPLGGKVSLPGTSDTVFNVGGYYEKYGLSLRLQYQVRTNWLDTLGAAADGGDQFWATDNELDFSARYAVTPNFEVYFDASNLINQPGRRYVRDSRYTIEWERFGRRYTGGVRVNF